MKLIEDANQQALTRILEGEPRLIDIVPARQLIPGLRERMILHAGPPISWDRMCGPMRGAVAGAIVFEGWAKDLLAATKLAASGEIEFHPNHHFGAVGPMTGMTTMSMPLFVVENARFANRAYCAINEGLGKVMRFGGNDLKSIVARGLSMGDELHQRNLACSSVFLREIAPWMARTSTDNAVLAECLAFIGQNDQFFLNIAMAMGKAITDPANGIRGSTIVTTMCRNGTDFGIRVSGLGEQWFTAPVEMPEGLYFAGYSEKDANPDMGDSAIVETIGLGGFAMAAAPAVAGFVGAGAPSEAGNFTRSMGEITVAQNPEWTIAAMDFAGVPTGIDIRLVVDSGVVPVINTGIAHREPGIGQVGAGVVKAPLACFQQAIVAIAKDLGVS
jgi:hypothetical protein